MSVQKNLVWNGSAWVEFVSQVWNGSAWVNSHDTVWNGSSWIQIPNWQAAGPYPAVAMTSPTAPAPYQCSSSTNYNTGTYREWRAFNQTNANDYCWLSGNNDTAPWIRLYMGGVALRNIYILLTNRNSSAVNGIYAANIQGSNDGANWATIGSISGRNGDTSNLQTAHYCWNSDDTYTWVRLCPTDWRNRTSGSNNYVAVGELAIYGQIAA